MRWVTNYRFGTFQKPSTEYHIFVVIFAYAVEGVQKLGEAESGDLGDRCPSVGSRSGDPVGWGTKLPKAEAII